MRFLLLPLIQNVVLKCKELIPKEGINIKLENFIKFRTILFPLERALIDYNAAFIKKNPILFAARNQERVSADSAVYENTCFAYHLWNDLFLVHLDKNKEI